MTESATTPAAKGGLSAMLLPELKKVAGGLGIKSAGMKKADLVAAIKAAQSGTQKSGRDGEGAGQDGAQRSQAERPEQTERPEKSERAEQTGKPEQTERTEKSVQAGQAEKAERPGKSAQAPQTAQTQKSEQGPEEDRGGQKSAQQGRAQNNPNTPNPQSAGAEEEGGSRRNRRRRGRDRDRAAAPGGQNAQAGQGGQGSSGASAGGGERRGNRHEPDLQILEDDVLAPCAGILDVLDSYAFVRTSGYMPGSADVYVSLSTVRKYGLRRGDAIVGQVRQPREGDRKEKFNPLVKIDSVNGGDPEAARTRVDFAGLTPVHPTERLRLETGPTNRTGRTVDLAAPIGKGQRGLIVSPAQAGKTTLLQGIASSITANNPECHLMVVLVEERPEEVTDFERLVNGEVIASTFDRPASDHTMVAELAIERAKRLVELGHDVVVLLDGITRLGRAYNLASQASGRILPGGVDATALFPPKKFFGAARNIEDGGSLTILATAVVESSSKMDEIIFEELHGAANSVIRLSKELADKGIFPAIDVTGSGTRHEELLMSEQEVAVLGVLRRSLADLEPLQAAERLVERLSKSSTNLDLLMQVQKSAASIGSSSTS